MTAMRFTSTRDVALAAGFSEAILQGLAPDGGLYVPTRWPQVAPQTLPIAADLPRLASDLLGPFVAGDVLSDQLAAIAGEAFSFTAPLVPVTPDKHLSVLELFHGPTAAFKDFGARFLARCLARLRSAGSRSLEVLVATSGDTGSAVASAFHDQPGIAVVVLFPKGLVSPLQEHQLTCWGGNVRAFAVRGTFDDCQRIAKEALLDARLRERSELSSANSINLGRLLPQTVYYAAASLAIWREHGEFASFIVPSGNLGNVVACIWARRLGLPIADVVLAHNANRAVPDYFASGEWQPRPSVATLASAMDVGNPSNMERLRTLLPDLGELRSVASAYSISDAEIRERIRTDFARYDRIWCPHTATAAEVYERLPPEQRRTRRWILVATAHPAKFREIVEPLIGRAVPMPETLARLIARPTACEEIAADLGALRGALG
jgi:threonine synthase